MTASSQPQREPPGLWRPAIVAGLLMAACFVRALSWQWVNQRSWGVRLTPRGEHLLMAAALAVPLFPAVALLWSAITRRLKTRLTVALVVLIVVGAGAGLFAAAAWVPLFDGKYESSAVSADGLREGHLRNDGLLGCHARIYVAERGGLWGELAAERDVDCEGPMGVGWLADGGVEVRGNEPRPSGLYFGPH